MVTFIMQFLFAAFPATKWESQHDLARRSSKGRMVWRLPLSVRRPPINQTAIRSIEHNNVDAWNRQMPELWWNW
jgi:hypothetical protein